MFALQDASLNIRVLRYIPLLERVKVLLRENTKLKVFFRFLTFSMNKKEIHKIKKYSQFSLSKQHGFFIFLSDFRSRMLNSFVPNVPFFYPLKKSENREVF